MKINHNIMPKYEIMVDILQNKINIITVLDFKSIGV